MVDRCCLVVGLSVKVIMKYVFVVEVRLYL